MTVSRRLADGTTVLTEEVDAQLLQPDDVIVMWDGHGAHRYAVLPGQPVVARMVGGERLALRDPADGPFWRVAPDGPQ